MSTSFQFWFISSCVLILVNILTVSAVEMCTGNYQATGRPPVGTKCIAKGGKICHLDSGSWGNSWCYTGVGSWGAECVECPGNKFVTKAEFEQKIDSIMTALDSKNQPSTTPLETCLGNLLAGLSSCGTPQTHHEACPSGWNFTLTGCYKFVDGTTWTEGANNCEKADGFLAEINSQEEQDTLWQLYQDSGLSLSWVFLGATDVAQEGKWVWSHSGREMTFTAWKNHENEPNEPNGGTRENCLTAPPGWNFKWNDLSCDRKSENSKAICEFDRKGPYTEAVQACLWGNSLNNYSDMSLEECKEKCSSFTDCKSLDYLDTPNKWKTKWCYLKTETKATKPGDYIEPCEGDYANSIYLEKKG